MIAGSAMTPVRASLACIRCEHFRPEDDPLDSPFSGLLRKSGYTPRHLPFWPFLTTKRWLQARVTIGDLEINYRHPDPDLLLISRIARVSDHRSSLRPPIIGLIRFFLHAIHGSSELSAVISTISPDDPNGEYPPEHAAFFYEKMVGFVEKIPLRGRIWYVGDPHDSRRRLDSRFWKRNAGTEAERAALS
jgi:hypothetical protein